MYFSKEGFFLELAYEESQQTALCPEAAQEVQVNIHQ